MQRVRNCTYVSDRSQAPRVLDDVVLSLFKNIVLSHSTIFNLSKFNVLSQRSY